MQPDPATPAAPAAPTFTIGFSGSRRLIAAEHAAKAVAVRERTLAQLKEWLASLRAIREVSGADLAAVCSLAVGGDSLFIEACKDLEIPVTVLLPQPLDKFLAATGSDGSPDFIAEEAKAARNLAKGAVGIEVAATSADRRERFEQVNREIIRRCDLLYCLDHPTTGQPVKRGGTGHAAEQARAAGKPVVEGAIPGPSEVTDAPAFIIGIAAPEGFSQAGHEAVSNFVRSVFEWVRADPEQYRVDPPQNEGTGLGLPLGLSQDTPILVLHHVSHADEQWLADDIAGDMARPFGLALTRVRPFHADPSVPAPREFVAELAEDSRRDLVGWHSQVQSDRKDPMRSELRRQAALEHLAAHSDLLVVVASEAEVLAGRASAPTIRVAGPRRSWPHERAVLRPGCSRSPRRSLGPMAARSSPSIPIWRAERRSHISASCILWIPGPMCSHRQRGTRARWSCSATRSSSSAN